MSLERREQSVFSRLRKKISELVTNILEWLYSLKEKQIGYIVAAVLKFIFSPISRILFYALGSNIRRYREEKIDTRVLEEMVADVEKMPEPIRAVNAFLLFLFSFSNRLAITSRILSEVEYQMYLYNYPFRPADVLAASIAHLRGRMSARELVENMRSLGLSGDKAQAYLEQVKHAGTAYDYAIASLRGYISESEYFKLCEKIPVTRDYAKIILETSRQFLTISEYATAWRRGIISEAEFVQKLKTVGLKPSEIPTVMKLAETLLGLENSVNAWLRGLISDREFELNLRKLGYSAENIELIKKLSFYVPPPADLIRMSVREVFSQEIARKYGMYEDFPIDFEKYAKWQGISPFWARAYWAAHWDLPSVSQGFEMLHRGIITYDELKTLMRALDIMPYWRDKLIKLSYHPYTRVDTRRMYRLGVLSEKDVYKTYKDLGYDDERARNLTRFTILDAVEEEREFTKAELIDAYKRNIITAAEFRKHLKDLNYADDVINYLQNKAELDKVKEIRKNELDRIKVMFQTGQFDTARTEQELIKLNLAQAEINYYIALWSPKTRERQTLPSKGDLSRWVKAGIISIDRYVDYMRALGYSDESISYYLLDLAGEYKA